MENSKRFRPLRNDVHYPFLSLLKYQLYKKQANLQTDNKIIDIKTVYFLCNIEKYKIMGMLLCFCKKNNGSKSKFLNKIDEFKYRSN